MGNWLQVIVVSLLPIANCHNTELGYSFDEYLANCQCCL